MGRARRDVRVPRAAVHLSVARTVRRTARATLSRPTNFGVGGDVQEGAVHLHETVGMWWLSQRLGTIGDTNGHCYRAIAAEHRKTLNARPSPRVQRP